MTSLVPPNATAFERAVDQMAEVRLGGIGTPLRQLWSAELCSVALLPWLAWGLSVDQWDSAWPLSARRARVAAAIPVQRHKGTLKAVRDVVSVFGGAISISEWWQQSPVGTPHTFTMTLSLPSLAGAAPSTEYIDTVIAEVTATKPLRAHFDFVLAQSAIGRIGVRAVARPVLYVRLPLVAPAA